MRAQPSAEIVRVECASPARCGCSRTPGVLVLQPDCLLQSWRGTKAKQTQPCLRQGLGLIPTSAKLRTVLICPISSHQTSFPLTWRKRPAPRLLAICLVAELSKACLMQMPPHVPATRACNSLSADERLTAFLTPIDDDALQTMDG